MSQALIRAALETAVAAIAPPLSTANENVPFTPVADVPYQEVFVLFATPDNPEIGPVFIERGMLQVNLQYPKGQGSGVAAARAKLLRDAFPFGSSLTNGGVTVNITKTPEIASGRATDDRWMLPVKIPFTAFIGG